jgi:hypothetical protein
MIVERRFRCTTTTVMMQTRWEVAQKNAAAAKALALKIKEAKEAAVRARANAEKALKAKTNRLNAKLRQQKIREKIQEQRRTNLTKLSSELCARTEANEEEAEEIYAAA